MKVSNAGRASLVNVGFNDQTDALSRSSVWQVSKTDVSRLVYENDVIELATEGGLSGRIVREDGTCRFVNGP